MTATRWARILRSLECRVRILEAYEKESCDVLVALHARRSHPSVVRFRDRNEQHPVVVALTGTDLYLDFPKSAEVRESLELADQLIVLQPFAEKRLPSSVRSKIHVVIQSATRPRGTIVPKRGVFEVSVIGHLRSVKDPMRPAYASRRLPRESRIEITQVGAALEERYERNALAEGEKNPRYRWIGEVPRWKALRVLARSRLVVLPSKMEGGANVICEALASGVPVLSTRIDGSIGLLGEDYPGYFDVGDTTQLAELMFRAESDEKFYRLLKRHCDRRAGLVHPERERQSLERLLASLA